MKCFIREGIVDYHYTAWYNDGKQDRNLGDIFFDRELQICRVRFYGWSTGIPSSALAKICDEIHSLEQTIKGRIT